MKLVDRDETVLVVVGAGETTRDRPYADTVRDAVDARGNGQFYRRAVVVGDAEYLDRPELHRHPTIAVGGPGVNAVSQRLVAESPALWQSEDRAFVQGDIEGIPKRVVIWGMDAAATGRAVDAFVSEGMLDLLLDRIWRFKPVAIV